MSQQLYKVGDLIQNCDNYGCGGFLCHWDGKHKIYAVVTKIENGEITEYLTVDQNYTEKWYRHEIIN